MMVYTIALREIRTMFVSPLAWCMLAVAQIILSYIFLTQIDDYLLVQPRLAGLERAPGVTELIVARLFAKAAVVLLMLVPLVTMRLISEERRSHTLALLLSAPLSMTEIIVGKYLGAMLFMVLVLGLVTLMSLALLLGGSLDWGLLASCMLGMLLLLASYTAVGLYMSTLTRQPGVAAMGTFGILFMLWIIDWAGMGASGADAAGGGVNMLAYLSLLRHYESFLQGVFDTSDVVYYLLFIATFLVLSVRRLDNERLQA